MRLSTGSVNVSSTSSFSSSGFAGAFADRLAEVAASFADPVLFRRLAATITTGSLVLVANGCGVGLSTGCATATAGVSPGCGDETTDGAGVSVGVGFAVATGEAAGVSVGVGFAVATREAAGVSVGSGVALGEGSTLAATGGSFMVGVGGGASRTSVTGLALGTTCGVGVSLAGAGETSGVDSPTVLTLRGRVLSA